MLYCKWSCFADAGLEVEVKDPPKGMIPPGTQMVKPKTEPQPSKVSSLYPLIKNYGHECAHIKTLYLEVCCHPSNKPLEKKQKHLVSRCNYCL